MLWVSIQKILIKWLFIIKYTFAIQADAADVFKKIRREQIACAKAASLVGKNCSIAAPDVQERDIYFGELRELEEIHNTLSEVRHVDRNLETPTKGKLIF